MAEVVMGTAYEINKEIWGQLANPDEQIIKTQLGSLGSWLSSNYKNHYYMLLCREKHDYTIIHLKQSAYYEAAQEVQEVLETRGSIIDIGYSHEFGFYECWVREPDGEVNMYAFFPCDDWVIEVE